MKTTTENLTTDDLNDIARQTVSDIIGERPPANMNDDERDEWRAEADRLFLMATK